MIHSSRALLWSTCLLFGCLPELSGLQDGESSEASSNVGGFKAAAGGIGGVAAGGTASVSTGATVGGTANPPFAVGGNTAAGNAPLGGSPPLAGPACGSAGMTAYLPTGAEACDGIDDDCNGVVDDGCPGGLSTTYVKDLDLIGDSFGGSPFTADCNAGEVLGGIWFAVGGFITQAKGVCYALELKPADNAVHGFEVSLAKPRELPPHPANPATNGDPLEVLSCSPGEVVVGLKLSQQRYTFTSGVEGIITPRAWLTCARLVLKETDGGLTVSWEGPKQIGPVSGGLLNENANWFVETNATAPLVASRLRGQAGGFIDRLGFGVSELNVVYR
jgi:hypothetical protein